MHKQIRHRASCTKGICGLTIASLFLVPCSLLRDPRTPGPLKSQASREHPPQFRVGGPKIPAFRCSKTYYVLNILRLECSKTHRFWHIRSLKSLKTYWFLNIAKLKSQDLLYGMLTFPCLLPLVSCPLSLVPCPLSVAPCPLSFVPSQS